MAWLDAIKGAVFQDVPAPAAPAAAPVAVAPVAGATFAAPINYGPAVNADFVAAIKKGTYARNTAFTQLLGAADKLASIIPDQNTRLKAAYATAGDGRSVKQIADAVDIHLSDVDGEEARFKQAMDRKVADEVGGGQRRAKAAADAIAHNQQAIAQLQQQIAELTAQISTFQNDHAQGTQAANDAQTAIDRAAAEFKVAANAVRAELASSKAAIMSSLG
jgi:chromosome segregation ATPase